MGKKQRDYQVEKVKADKTLKRGCRKFPAGVFDIMTYSFPCQDLSVAGKQKGMTKGSGTRSGLLWEVERLLNECSELPQVLLMENVPQAHSKANMPDFQKWIDFLESKGYSNYWQDLNSKDYGGSFREGYVF